MMGSNEKIWWCIAAIVRVTNPGGSSVTRRVPVFKVHASDQKGAYSIARDILTSSWSGPSIVEFTMMGTDSDSEDFWYATEKGVDWVKAK